MVCFAPQVLAVLVIIEGSEMYENIFQEDVRVAVHDLKMKKRRRVIQQDNDPKHQGNRLKKGGKEEGMAEP